MSYVIEVLFEGIFIFNIVINFFTDYVPDGEMQPEKDLGKIAERYWNQEFISDFIPTIPITFVLDMGP